jgi:acyl CoA:acetate/3-ketoacid CoA transferase beta subunit
VLDVLPGGAGLLVTELAHGIGADTVRAATAAHLSFA